jgi:hypothetical protein
VGVARNFAKFLPKLPKKNLLLKEGMAMANSMHNFNTKHSKKSFAATNVESFIMLWKWMLLNR